MGLEDDRNITVPRFQLPGPALILLGPALEFEVYKHPKILIDFVFIVPRK